ncbi:hypothetical protein SBA4_3740001 [Candidatus Sulfopaludibacter sp. SbA4]|nr:hypothetical protein SBA4_3740001 [Candidatus Sulfopaludibacter sp. SbA4]
MGVGDKRRSQWTDEEFFASGRLEVEEEILSDMTNVCQGRPPRKCASWRSVAVSAASRGHWRSFSERYMQWT